MSSISSFDSSEKDIHQRTYDGSILRQSHLRKLDLLDSNDNPRTYRDTDNWSLTASAGDQESIISTNTHKTRPIRDIDDDNYTSTTNHISNVSMDLSGPSLNISSVELGTYISQLDAKSTATTHSLVAECLKSELNSINDDDNNDKDTQTGHQPLSNNVREHHSHQDRQHYHHHHHYSPPNYPIVMDDSICAPTEPQPSIAAVNKPSTNITEENESLHARLRHLEIITKHQQNIINSMRRQFCFSETELNYDTLSEQLTIWAQKITHFSTQWTSTSAQQCQVEQALFHHATEYYLQALPFGTENQVVLNTAYHDQLIRFHKTLGPNYARWYRRQTVKSLERNPATREYLQNARLLMTQDIGRVLDMDCALLTDLEEWQLLLDTCAKLSLTLHSGEHDVLIRPLAQGSIYDADTMIDVDDDDDSLDIITTTKTPGLADDNDVERYIKSIVCPLFIDERNTILLPARVILE